MERIFILSDKNLADFSQAISDLINGTLRKDFKKYEFVFKNSCNYGLPLKSTNEFVIMIPIIADENYYCYIAVISMDKLTEGAVPDDYFRMH